LVKYLTLPGAVAGLFVQAGVSWWAAPLILLGSVAVLLIVTTLRDLPDYAAPAADVSRDALFFLTILTWLAIYGATRGLEVRMEFYAAVAQIAPVLFLALLVESRLPTRTREERSGVLAIAGTIFLAAAAALVPLATGRTTDGDPGLAIAGMATAAVAVVLKAIWRIPD
jgi:signal transduction histidine kinase